MMLTSSSSSSSNQSASHYNNYNPWAAKREREKGIQSCCCCSSSCRGGWAIIAHFVHCIHNEHGSALKNTHVAYTPKRDGLLLKKIESEKWKCWYFFDLFISIDASVARSRFSFSLFGYQVAGWTFFPVGSTTVAFFPVAGRGENWRVNSDKPHHKCPA